MLRDFVYLPSGIQVGLLLLRTDERHLEVRHLGSTHGAGQEPFVPRANECGREVVVVDLIGQDAQ